MNFWDNLLGKRKAWSTFCDEVNGKYIKGDLIVSDRVVKDNKDWTTILFSSNYIPFPYKKNAYNRGRTVGPAGYISRTFIVNPFLNKTKFHFNIWNKRFMGKLFIPEDDLTISGYKNLDDQLYFKTNNNDLLFKMLSNETIRHLLGNQTDFDFSIIDYQDGFKIENPEENLSELIFIKNNLIKDNDLLKNIFEMSHIVLEELKKLKVAEPIIESRLSYPTLKDILKNRQVG